MLAKDSSDDLWGLDDDCETEQSDVDQISVQMNTEGMLCFLFLVFFLLEEKGSLTFLL